MTSVENEDYNKGLFSKIYDILDKDEFYLIKYKWDDYNKQSICFRWQSLFEDIAYDVTYKLQHQAEVFGEGETGKAMDCNTAFKSLRKALDIIIEENEKIISEENTISMSF